MTEHVEDRRDKKRKCEVTLAKRSTAVNEAMPNKLDFQAYQCFKEPARRFPEPVSLNPIMYGKPGYMFHVNTTSGVGLEIPGRGVLLRMEEDEFLEKRHFTCRDRTKGGKERMKEEGRSTLLGQGVICWHLVKAGVLSDTFVICYDYPALERINLPDISEQLSGAQGGSSSAFDQQQT
jgi:hypothetical protein